jgi:copper chaperone CopZ
MMKTLKFIIAAVWVGMLGINSFAQIQDHSKMTTTKSDTIKVWGNCEMCKARIEKAAKLDGVSKAEWDTQSKILWVTFDTAKTSMDEISKNIAAAGHDNSKVKADDKAYNALPGCCRYERE